MSGHAPPLTGPMAASPPLLIGSTFTQTRRLECVLSPAQTMLPLPALAVVELIQSCWRRDPSQRPTAEQIVQRLQAFLGTEAAAEEEGDAEGAAMNRLPSSGEAAVLAAAQPPPPRPQPKARPANPFQAREGMLFP